MPREKIMKTNRSILFFAAFFLAATFFSASAYGASLTDAQVRNFVSSWSDVQVLFDEEYDEEDVYDGDDDDYEFSPSTMISEGLAEIRGKPVYRSLQRLVRQHGFSGVDDWASVGDRVMRAALALNLEGHAPVMDDEMAQAMREIQENPHLSEEMKQDMIQAMQDSVAMMAEFEDAPEADKNAVRPYLDELLHVWEDEDDDLY